MATIRDVARASRVSIATVSRVFNDSPSVSEETRQRVRAAAQSLGYWPNGIARSLITNRTHMLGVVLPDLHGEFFSEVIHGVDAASRAHGLHVLVSRASVSADELTSALRSMRGRVDGLVVMAPDLRATEALQQSAHSIPTVVLNPEHPMDDVDTVAVDNHGGARQVVGHLIKLGHRRIAMVTGPEHNADSRQRLEGYQRAMADASLFTTPDLVVRGDFTEPSGYDAALQLLARAPRPTALFVGNDVMAVGVLSALDDLGVPVPGDIAVAGFDDIPLARYLRPPLTTVHVDMQGLGRRAVELLLDPGRRDRLAKSRHDVLPTTLVVRRSCGEKPAEAPGRLRGSARPDRP